MSVHRIDPNQAKIHALAQASHSTPAAKEGKTAPEGRGKSETDSVTISKQAQAVASQLPTRATEAMETPAQEAAETPRQKATETALGLDSKQH
jgi:hypothetical protein